MNGCCESTLYMKVHYGEHVFAVCASFSQHRVEVSALAGVSVQGEFDHPEAVLTPPGGGMATRSIGRHAHVTPLTINRYSPCRDRRVSRLSERALRSLHTRARPYRGSLTILKLTRHHPVVGRPADRSADTIM